MANLIFVLWRRKIKVVLVQNKIAPTISNPDKYPESWTGEILAEKLGDAHSCLTLHLKYNVEVTSEPSHEHTLESKLEPETNEESSVPEPDEHSFSYVGSLFWDTVLVECNYASFRSIKKTTQTSIRVSSLQPDDEDNEDGESYDPSDNEDPPTKRTAFEQLLVTQDIHGAQLAEIVELTRCYADEFTHQRASIDHQEVMLACMCSRFMPDQDNSRDSGTDFGPQ
ncbi:hypothetical protein M9H77_03127 [Catharanthus roseus]|uniref:Uncharacterized protein n=1 Tax=Catharanthus roseus TaxID=4058 RepID=A0ACC0CAT6_CATRO|nr:hypothetical protein M9H77_03127 [Catharanthus roseus]